VQPILADQQSRHWEHVTVRRQRIAKNKSGGASLAIFEVLDKRAAGRPAMSPSCYGGCTASTMVARGWA
jgi:hypothetical protein